MSGETLASMFQWLFSQDPVVMVVVALLIRAEIKRGSAGSILAELLEINKPTAAESKAAVSKGG